MKQLWKDFMNGIITENAVLKLMIGLCPVLAVSTTVMNGIGMGFATTFVLLGSNLTIALIRNIVPKEIRIPIFIIVIATFVIITDLSMAAYFPGLHKALGIFIPLIVVNCIIMGRAEAFASRNTLIRSIADGLGMGIGFILILILLSGARELLGKGTILGVSLPFDGFEPALIMILPPGAFFAIGIMIAIFNNLFKLKSNGGHKHGSS
ncbi:MAG: Electron transport complex subunit RnfE [candidate division WS2 bacterium]|uniref:Ion-translocating oxidoreductase complex subunit E n=1 Tax=Psychracetigena formicireducens TaxID=2986056 RepID=A0A9E2BG01_PSYF1|nr:Electron transport complex subunit RnfE [Candidatus Psychracetigena formicireducens]MBT9144289.1 Electron transport complex subunit RnfE [Candidatus Psychracetigena formicireducens]MBT9149933.1 Electron transport complex subunit RnfE [Candidatus Psychracetigena formicireducens]